MVNDKNLSKNIIDDGYETAQKYSIENVSKILKNNILKSVEIYSKLVL